MIEKYILLYIFFLRSLYLSADAGSSSASTEKEEQPDDERDKEKNAGDPLEPVVKIRNVNIGKY